jgi:putative transcriptional regulator
MVLYTSMSFWSDENLCWRMAMAVRYKKLWLLLKKRNLKKKDLQSIANISSTSITKLAKDETVRTDTLDKICLALQCDISDIMEIVEEGRNEQ